MNSYTASRFRLYIALTALLTFTACTNSYNRVDTGGTERASVRLDENRAVLITTPKDGGYEGRIYKGSGAVVARHIDAAFSRSARIVDVSPTPFHNLDDLQDVVAKNDYGYIVVPVINVWSHSDKGHSQASNMVGVRIRIIDAINGQDVASTFLDAKAAGTHSLTGIFIPDTTPPDDMLAAMAKDYVDSLYGSWW